MSLLKCCGCKERFDKETMIKLPAGNFHSIDCAISCARIAQAKSRAKQIAKAKACVKVKDKADKRAARALKDSNYSHQFKLTKQKIQHWVNHVRDKGKPCISCGTSKPDIIYCGGHYKTAGGHPEIALEPKNIHRQCNFHCNSNLSGNISGNKNSHGFTAGLISRYGQDYVDFLNSYHKPKRYTCAQLKEIRAYYSKLINKSNH